jgi:hypothetical protein
MNILYASIDDVPRHYQRHTVGVSTSIGRLLRKLSWAVACYNEKHH